MSKCVNKLSSIILRERPAEFISASLLPENEMK
ncbi:hypothetical protein QF042_004952 [Pedobacter sp. W3I1]|nr:hypothetical protein [Pedobacter sp. W3I1]